MKVFLDTNVLVAAFITHGPCKELFEHCVAAHTVCVSQQVLNEFERVLKAKLRFQQPLVDRALSYINANALMVEHDKVSAAGQPICRDPDDDAVLMAALEGGADCTISGDEDLLVIGEFHGMPIIKPSGFWEFEKLRLNIKDEGCLRR